DDLTIFDRDLAVERFDLADVQKNPAVFDLDKLTWINGEYVRAMEPAEFAAAARPWVEGELGSLADDEWAAFVELAPLVQERTKLMAEIPDQVRFLYTDSVTYDEQAWKKVMAKDGVDEVLDAVAGALEGLAAWDTGSIEQAMRQLPEQLERGAGKVFQPVRVAVTGSS